MHSQSSSFVQMFERETRREKILDGRNREMKLKEKTGTNKVIILSIY